MKIKLRLLGSIMLLFLVATAAQAVVILQDNFSEYVNGPLGTNTPTWFAPPGDPTYTTNLEISVSSGSVVINYAGSASVQSWALFTNGVPGYSISLPSSGPGSAITNTSGTCYYFPSNGPVAALYSSFTMNVSSAFSASASGDYFAMFLGTNFNLHPRIYICTNSATPGFYRLLLNNNSAPSTGTNGVEIISQDLAYGTTYDVVFKQVLSTGLSTLWVGTSFPSSEVADAGLTNLTVSPTAAQSAVLLGGGISLTDTTGTNVPSFTALCGFGFHTGSAYGSGAITINSLICGTTFADVVPASAGSNPPFISIQPASGTNFTGSSTTLSVVVGGDQSSLTYQWYGPSGIIIGATSSNYTIASVLSGGSGYSVAITNAAGNVTSSTATITGITSSAIPTITTQPANTSITGGGSASFSVVASDGGPPLTYQWYVGASPILNQTNPTLSLASVAYSQAGSYSVHVSNANGTTNSTGATLTVNPPATVSIAYLHSLVDTNYAVSNIATTTLYTAVGTVTTWHDMTSSGSTEFYMQDATGGICVFWDDAPSSTNLPPAGAIVSVTAPLSQFDSLVEMEPVFGNAFETVTILSTNNPLPAPKPLPFDSFIGTNAAVMVKELQGTYFVASNVFLNLATNSTFTSVNEPLTNGFLSPQALTELAFTPQNGTNHTVVTTNTLSFTNLSGETFTIYFNGYCDYIGQLKPTGPVTIYGVLGQFDTTTPYTNGYEFTPSRMADIVGPLAYTNVITNIVRYGDLATNSYVENVLQPGETITMTVSVTDPAGGTVSISALPTSPSSAGSPTWTILSSGGTVAKASFTYTAVTGDEGVNLTNSLQYTLSSGTFTANWTVYVPTTDEQKIRITEVLPYASNNTNSPAFNPLGRPLPESNSVSYDQYVEIVNFSPDTYYLNYSTVGPAVGSPAVTFINGEAISPGSSVVLYGGPTSDPDAPTISGAIAAYNPGPLSLGAASGTVALHDNNGYLVDRISYAAAGSQVLNSNFNYTGQIQANLPVCSYSRFPSPTNGPLVPQVFISTNYVTPGTQYNGAAWGSSTTLPAGVGPITTAAAGSTATLNFSASTSSTTTLWIGNSLLQPFSVLTGGLFGSSSGSFTISNTPPTFQYYYITTQAQGGGGPMGGD